MSEEIIGAQYLFDVGTYPFSFSYFKHSAPIYSLLSTSAPRKAAFIICAWFYVILFCKGIFRLLQRGDVVVHLYLFKLSVGMVLPTLCCALAVLTTQDKGLLLGVPLSLSLERYLLMPQSTVRKEMNT